MPRFNSNQPPDWLAAFKRAAKREKLSLSEWMGNACRAALPERERAKLSERPPACRPKKEAK